MRTICLLIASASLLAIGEANAQRVVTAKFGSGLSTPATDPGLHLSGAVELANRSASKRLRAEGMILQGEVRDLLAMGSAILARDHGKVRPYVVAGAGVYFDNGVPFMAAGGAGVALHEAALVPLHLEARIAQTRDTFILLTFGVDLARSR